MNAKKSKMSDAPAAAAETEPPVVVMPDEFNTPAAEPAPGSAENPLPPDALPPVEAGPVAEAEAGAEPAVAAKPAPIDGPVALLGKTQEDAAAAAHAAGTLAETPKPAEPAAAAAAEQGADPAALSEPETEEAEPKEPQPPTQEAIAMASMLECAAAMCGMLNADPDFLPPELTPEVAMCLADYFRNEPTAPAAGGLMQLRLKQKVILLPNEDPRRVELTLDLFRLAVTRMEQFIAEDAKAETDRQMAQQPLKSAKPGDGEGTFERVDERFDKSDIGKALDRRGQ